MYSRHEIIEDIDKCTVKYYSTPNCSPQEALNEIKRIRNDLDPKSPIHYNRIIIDERISLWLPGKYDKYYPGDYLMTRDDKPPEHKEICDAFINLINSNGATESICEYWISVLEDIYINGTRNLNECNDEREKHIRQVVFWLTLQEDINHSKVGGRKVPLCRYAEAILIAMQSGKYKYEELIARLDESNPETLDEWNFSRVPVFYGWRAF